MDGVRPDRDRRPGTAWHVPILAVRAPDTEVMHIPRSVNGIAL